MFLFCFAKSVLMNMEQKALSTKGTTLTGQFPLKIIHPILIVSSMNR